MFSFWHNPTTTTPSSLKRDAICNSLAFIAVFSGFIGIEKIKRRDIPRYTSAIIFLAIWSFCFPYCRDFFYRWYDNIPEANPETEEADLPVITNRFDLLLLFVQTQIEPILCFLNTLLGELRPSMSHSLSLLVPARSMTLPSQRRFDQLNYSQEFIPKKYICHITQQIMFHPLYLLGGENEISVDESFIVSNMNPYTKITLSDIELLVQVQLQNEINLFLTVLENNKNKFCNLSTTEQRLLGYFLAGLITQKNALFAINDFKNEIDIFLRIIDAHAKLLSTLSEIQQEWMGSLQAYLIKVNAHLPNNFLLEKETVVLIKILHNNSKNFLEFSETPKRLMGYFLAYFVKENVHYFSEERNFKKEIDAFISMLDNNKKMFLQLSKNQLILIEYFVTRLINLYNDSIDEDFTSHLSNFLNANVLLQLSETQQIIIADVILDLVKEKREFNLMQMIEQVKQLELPSKIETKEIDQYVEMIVNPIINENKLSYPN